MMTATGVPMIHSEDMGVQCEFCAGRSFRRSKLQGKDVMPLLFLRYPVRCLSCSKRQAVNLAVAQRAVSSRVKQVRAARDEAAHGWNASDPKAQESGPSMVGGTVGGTRFTALPERAPIAMPELKGVTLKHLQSFPTDQTQTQ